ncbi:restriction endonuclease [Rothia amarae]
MEPIFSLHNGLMPENSKILVPPWPYFIPHILAVLDQANEPVQKRVLMQKAVELASLSEEALAERIDSGTSRAFDRADWTVFNLYKGGFVKRTARGVYQISDKGRAWHLANPSKVLSYSEATKLLLPSPESNSVQKELPPIPIEVAGGTPEDQIGEAMKTIREETTNELLNRLYTVDPSFFEKTVVDLLLAMGYGGAEGKGSVLGKTGDGGIDGVIDQDALGLDQVYIQAKRYGKGNSVGAGAIRDFRGALSIHGSKSGVFITTSSFTKDAIDAAVVNSNQKIVLIDGKRLTTLMIKYKVGVQVAHTYEVVRLDEDYFEELA